MCIRDSPSNASEDLKTALSDYNTVEYKAGNSEDRISKLNSLNDLKFSLAVDDKNYEKPITVEDVDILRSIGRKSINDFTSKDIQKSQKWAYKFYKELGTKSPFFRAWFGDWRANDTSKIKVVSVPTIDISDVVLEKGDYTISDTGWTVHAGKTLREETSHYARGEKVSVKALSTLSLIHI